MNSIRRALLMSIIGVSTLLLLISAALSYRAGLQEAGELFDAKLAHSSRVLLSLTDAPLAELPERSPDVVADTPMVISVWHGTAGSGIADMVQPGGHAYETKLAFQVRDSHGVLLLRSDSGPTRRLAPLVPGFADVEIDGQHWRTFTLKSPSGRWYQSGELSAIREEIAEEIALGTLLPLLAAVPLLALFVWIAVDWACRSLLRVSDAVEQRSPDHLEPIHLDRVPHEIQGIVKSVNGLIARLEAALARERRFTADAAHELRTPLAALKVHAYNLRHAASATERDQSQSHLDAGIQRMERLVAQMLTLSRMENGTTPVSRRPIDLAAVLEQHCRDYAASGIADGKHLHVSAEPVSVNGDELALDALVRNLLDNALRHTPHGGSVIARARRHDGHAEIVIEDSGPGIPEAARQRVFERFHRELGTNTEGSGLGLSIVTQALHLHQGRIALDASPELGGLRVTIALPAAPDLPST